MKHKILMTVLSAAAVLCLGLGLAACGNEQGTKPDGEGPSAQQPGEQTPEHVHTFTVDNVCSGCGDKWEYTEGLNYMLAEGFEGVVDAHEVYYVVDELEDPKALVGDIVIPYGYNGKWVRAIWKDAFSGCENITSVAIPESVTTIIPGAFEGCTSLTSIVIPDSVTSLGEYAFGGCTALTSVKIGSGVETIGYSTFGGCTALSEIILPDSPIVIEDCDIEDTALYKDPASWDESGTLYIGNHLIKAKGTPGGAYTVRAGTKSIAANAFKNQTYPEKEEYSYSMTSVVLPDGLLAIGEQAFYDCTALSEITMPDSAVRIEDTFEKTAYYQDQSHWDNGNVLYIGNHIIKAKDLSGSYTVKAGTKSIARRAFSGCDELSAIELPSSVVFIGEYAFSYCSALGGIVIPDGVKEIKYSTFDGCSSLATVKLGSGVESIGGGAFGDCKALKGLTIPKNVTKLAYTVLSNCDSLETLEVEEGNKVFRSSGNCIISIERNAVIMGGCKTTVIPEGVTEIGRSAFQSATAPTEITIPDNVKKIASSAFYGCTSLQTIKLPSGLTEIEDTMFYECSALESVVIPETVTVIGEWAFSGCSALDSIVIPKNVTRIEHSAFYGCSNLQSVTFVDPTGWKCHYYDLTSYEWAEMDCPVDQLSDQTTAASVLLSSSEQRDCYWDKA